MSDKVDTKQAEVQAGLMPPMDDVVAWLLAERVDFEQYKAQHRPMFYDPVGRICRSNPTYRRIVQHMMPWVRVTTDHEIRLRGLEGRVKELEGFVAAYRSSTASALVGKPAKRKPKPKKAAKKKKKARPAIRVDRARNEEMRKRGEDALQKLAAKEEATPVKETAAVGGTE